ncbi:hypothetical protein [Tropicimonas sp. S265A]|uniref:hypothetical protein n=1 Tax=Tropicimonas sp. S265A TaxID=3415134 RepID=UPI003C7DF2FC
MDIAIILGAFCVGVISVTLAYWRGGRSWTILGAIRGPLDKDGKRVRRLKFKPRSGVYGEILTLFLLAVLVFGVNFLTDDVSIWGLVQQFPSVAVSCLTLICILVLLFDSQIMRKAAQDGRSQRYRTWLKAGYVAYFPYAVVNFSFMILIVVLVVAQTFAFAPDIRAITSLLDTQVANLGAAALSPDDRMVVVEEIFGTMAKGAGLMVDQINALILLVLASFCVRVLVRYTPISQAYTETSLQWFDRLLFLSIACVAAAAWSVHYFTYDGFFGTALVALDQQRAAIAAGGWEMLQRFNDIYLSLSKQRGLTGFMIALTSDRGGLLLALSLAVWLSERRKTQLDADTDAQDRVVHVQCPATEAAKTRQSADAS